MRTSSLILGALALLVGIDASAGGQRRMDDAERAQFRTELLRQEFTAGRRVGARRDGSERAQNSRDALSPEERRALREQVRQNAGPWDGARGTRTR